MCSTPRRHTISLPTEPEVSVPLPNQNKSHQDFLTHRVPRPKESHCSKEENYIPAPTPATHRIHHTLLHLNSSQPYAEIKSASIPLRTTHRGIRHIPRAKLIIDLYRLQAAPKGKVSLQDVPTVSTRPPNIIILSP